MVCGSKKDQEMSSSALHNRPITLGGSGQIASDRAYPAPTTLCCQGRGAGIVVF
jgi:hypothetical protein